MVPLHCIEGNCWWVDDGDGDGGGSKQCTKVSTKASSLDVTNTQDRCFVKFRRENFIYLAGSNCEKCEQDCTQIKERTQFCQITWMTFKNNLLSFKIEVLEIAEHVSTTFWQQFNWQVTLSGSQMNLESRSESHFQEQVALVGNQATRGSRQWLTRWWGVTRPTGWRSSRLERTYKIPTIASKRDKESSSCWNVLLAQICNTDYTQLTVHRKNLYWIMFRPKNCHKYIFAFVQRKIESCSIIHCCLMVWLGR